MLFPSYFLSPEYTGALETVDPSRCAVITAEVTSDPEEFSLLGHDDLLQEMEVEDGVSSTVEQMYSQAVTKNGLWLPGARIIKFGFAIAEAAEVEVSQYDRTSVIGSDESRRIGLQIVQLGIATGLMSGADPQVYNPNKRYVSFNNAQHAGLLANTSAMGSALAIAPGPDGVEHVQVLSGFDMDGNRQVGLTRHLKIMHAFDHESAAARITLAKADTEHFVDPSQEITTSTTRQSGASTSCIDTFASPILRERGWPVARY